LLIVGLFVDIRGSRPIAVRHRARRVSNHRNIEAIQPNVTVFAGIDMKDQANVANALRRLRCQLRVGGQQARTHDIAVAIFEVTSRQLPTDRHLHLPTCVRRVGISLGRGGAVHKWCGNGN
jgi:hypothetical protein